MKYLNYIKALLYFFIPLILLLLIFTLLYYFDIVSNNVFKYLKIIIVIISCLISGFKIGKYSKQKGYLKGLILGGIISIIFLIINISLNTINISQIIYYLIIIISTCIGSMFGINKNNQKNS